MLNFFGVIFFSALIVRINAVHIVIGIEHSDKFIVIIIFEHFGLAYSDTLGDCEPSLKPVFAFDRAGVAFLLILCTVIKKSDISFTFQKASIISASSESESGFLQFTSSRRSSGISSSCERILQNSSGTTFSNLPQSESIVLRSKLCKFSSKSIRLPLSGNNSPSRREGKSLTSLKTAIYFAIGSLRIVTPYRLYDLGMLICMLLSFLKSIMHPPCL